MVRIRPNEVVDDRVLLGRARAEITRLKQLLRQVLDNALQSDKSGSTPTALYSRGHSRDIGRVEEETGEEIALTGCSDGDARTVKQAAQNRQVAKLIADNERLRDDNNCLLAKIQRLEKIKQTMKRRRRGARSITPMRRIAPPIPATPVDSNARYTNAASQQRRQRPSSSRERCQSPRQSLSPASSPTLKPFIRREFATDGNIEGKPIEDDVSEGEIKGLIDDNLTTTSTGNREEEEMAQIEALRCSLLASEGRNGIEGNGVTSQRAASPQIGEIVGESQRMEDLLFEAQGRERRRIHEERERLNSSRTERLALEAQLADLMRDISHANAGIALTPAGRTERAVSASEDPTASARGLPAVTPRSTGMGTDGNSCNKIKTCWDKTADLTAVKSTPLSGRDSEETPTALSNQDLPNAAPAPKLPKRRRQSSSSASTLFPQNRDGQRPVTSASTAGKARMRRVRYWGSRSPTKHRASTLPIAHVRHHREKRKQKPTTTARLKVLMAKYSPPSSSSSLPSSPWEKRLLPGRGQCLTKSRTENGEQATGTTRLTFSTEDVGRRLQVIIHSLSER